MKHIGRLLVIAFLALASCKNTTKGTADETAKASTGSGAVIEFLEKSHDFGEMNEGDVVEHSFPFKNTGTSPLTILDVKVQCGCTVAAKPEKPIGVGQTDKIVVRFNSQGKLGINKKFVTIISDATNTPEPLEFTAVVNGKQLN